MVALTEQMVESGANLIRSLDKSGVKVTNAFWSYFSEIDDWKLIISMPEKKEQRSAYEAIQKSIHSKEFSVNLTIDQISTIKPQAPIIKLLKSAITTGPGISNIRFSQNVVNGQLIEDVHIYRIT